MGALTRFKDWFVGQQYWSMTTFTSWLEKYATELLTFVPGLTIGSTTEFDAVNFPGMYSPPSSGETEGEFYLSNDRTPPQLFVWQGANWWRIDTKDITTP